MLIDTHAHLQFEDFKTDFDQVLKRAAKNDIQKIILPGSNFASSQAGLKLAAKTNNLYAAVGIHPHYLDELNNNLKTSLTDLIKKSKPIAIGETGLDFYQIDENLKEIAKRQEQLFKLQIELAIKFKLPLIIHSRQAAKETFSILNDYKDKGIRGVFHCYAGGKKHINSVLGLGFYFGLDGNLTYDQGLQNVAKQIPLGKILLETDSPELTPLPLRGLRNEPENVKLVAEKLAQLKNCSFEEITDITSQNAKKLFAFK